MAQKITRIAGVALLGWMLGVGADVARGVGVEATALKPTDKLEFEQEKATAHMRELEERMYRISEMIRQTEQDHSARLILALQKSREDLLLEQMKEIRGLINAGKLDEAAAQQAKVVTKLEELRQLLLSNDLDLMLKLDRLRKLTDAIARADKLAKEEARLAAESDKLGKQDKADPKDVDQAKKDEQKNADATAALKSDVERLVPNSSPAPGKLGDAGKSMKDAQGKMSQGKPGEAKSDQDKAAEDIKKAKESLEDERQKLLEELQAQVRAQVNEALTQMLEKQKKIRESTEALANQMKPGNTAVVIAVRKLSGGETELVEIAEKTIVLVEQTEYSLAMPLALRSIQREMKGVVGGLDASRADAKVIAQEKEVERQIMALQETLKEQAKQQEEADSQSEGEPKKSEDKMAKLIAELKIARALQSGVNGQTKEADGQRPADGHTPEGEIKKRIEGVRDREGDVRDLMKRLDRKYGDRSGDPVS